MNWPRSVLLQLKLTPLLRVNPYRKDGTPGPFVPVGYAVADGAIYVRSMSPTGQWYRRAIRNGVGTIRIGRTVHDVTFHDATDGPHQAINTAFTRKYWMAGRKQVATITDPATYRVTVRIDPR
jgi:hypothetical protein